MACVLRTGHPHKLTFNGNWHPASLAALPSSVWFCGNISLALGNGHGLVATSEGRRGQFDFEFLLRRAHPKKYETFKSLAGRDVGLCGLNCTGQRHTQRLGAGE